MLDDDFPDEDDEDEDDEDDEDCITTLHVVHSREKLHWIDRVLGVRDVSTDMDDPDECP